MTLLISQLLEPANYIRHSRRKLKVIIPLLTSEEISDISPGLLRYRGILPLILNDEALSRSIGLKYLVARPPKTSQDLSLVLSCKHLDISPIAPELSRRYSTRGDRPLVEMLASAGILSDAALKEAMDL